MPLTFELFYTHNITCCTVTICAKGSFTIFFLTCLCPLEFARLTVSQVHRRPDSARPHQQVPAPPAQEKEDSQYQRSVPGKITGTITVARPPSGGRALFWQVRGCLFNPVAVHNALDQYTCSPPTAHNDAVNSLEWCLCVCVCMCACTFKFQVHLYHYLYICISMLMWVAHCLCFPDLPNQTLGNAG